MITAILTSAPNATLPRLRLDQLCLDWPVDGITWLARNQAVMLHLSHMPDDHNHRWAEWQTEQVDLNFTQTAPTPKRMLIADMDGTMIGQECLDELAEMAGVGDHVRQITARAMNGELNFDEALRERVQLLKDHPARLIDDVLKERISFMSGATILLATMRKHGAYAALVSGGFTPFTQYVSGQLGFDEHHGNTLIIANDTLTGDVANPIKGKQSKRQICLDLSTRLHVPLSDILTVGDGANDLAMLDIAGMGVAYRAKPVVAAASRWRINHGDLSALLYLQGYQKDDFIFP